jgi:hypothetical protein
MSEGIQRKKDKSLNLLATTDSVQSGSKYEDVTNTSIADQPPSSPPRASTPRAGAVVVEAYARVLGRKNHNFIPDKLLFEYIKHLVSIVQLLGFGVSLKCRSGYQFFFLRQGRVRI